MCVNVLSLTADVAADAAAGCERSLPLPFSLSIVPSLSLQLPVACSSTAVPLVSGNVA